MDVWAFLWPTYSGEYPVSQKKATDLKNSNGNCFILIIKQLFLLKSKIIRLIFSIFSSIFGRLGCKVKNQQTSKLPLGQNHSCCIKNSEL